MKRTQWQFTLLLILMLMTFNMNVMADKRIVERGMTKQEVIAILGRPQSTSFNQYGEQWEYLKEKILNYDHRIIVIFNNNGRVVSYQDIELNPGKDPDRQFFPIPMPPTTAIPAWDGPIPAIRTGATSCRNVTFQSSTTA